MATPGESRRAAAHHGRAGELFLIFLVNVVLTLITLGIYHFWGKTRIRRYLWTQTSVDDERLEYTGTGMELFLGYVLVIGFLVLLAVAYGVLVSLRPALELAATLALYGLLIVLVGVGIYRAQRYMLTRTRLRGVRLARTGSALGYAGRMIGHGLLALITLGLYWPFMRNALWRYAFNRTWYGSERFVYGGKGSELFPEFLLGAFLTPFTFGLSWLWYRAYEQRYLASRLRLQNVGFTLGFTGLQYIGFTLANVLALVFSLGLAYPWVLVRSLRFYTDHLTVAGELDYAAVAQSEEREPRFGEGLAQAFDLGGI